MAIEPEYTNFDVTLEWTESEKTVTLTHKGIVYETGDYDKNNMHMSMLRLNPSSPVPTKTFHREAGEYLAETFFPKSDPAEPDGLGDKFRETLEGNEWVRLRLFYPTTGDNWDKRAKILLDIPWEYLYLETKNPELSGFLCCKQHFSLAHCLPTQGDSDDPGVRKLPVRVAFLSTEGDHLEFPGVFDDVHEDIVERGRQNVLRLKEFTQAEKNDLILALQDFHIVQQLCHGEERSLFLKDDTVLIPELNDFLGGVKHEVKAVVLCACEAAVNPFGVAAALHRFGLPVVIGSARSITVNMAQLFMEILYSQLAVRFCGLEEALAVARNQLREYEPSTGRLSSEWGLPRLYLGGESSSIITEERLYEIDREALLQSFESHITRTLEKAQRARVSDGAAAAAALAPLAADDVQEKIDEWIESGRLGYLYLSGPSNTGKSTEIAQLLDRKKGQLVYHICFGAGEGFEANHPLEFSRKSLFPQLKEYYESRCGKKFGKWLREGVYPITANDAWAAFFDLVIEPLGKARDETRERPIIVIDGLDHAAQSSSPGYSILDLLCSPEYRERLTEVARLIVTADSDAHDNSGRNVHDRIKELRPLFEIPMTEIGEEAPSPERMKEFVTAQLQKYVGPRLHLDESTWLKGWQEDVLRQPAEAESAPIFQQALNFAKYLPDDQAVEIAQRLDLPKAGLNDWHQAYLDYVRPPDDEEQAEQINRFLKVLAVAYDPLPVDMVARLIELSDGQVGELVKQLERFVERLEPQGLACDHPSIKRFLAATFSVDEAHGLFTEMYRRESGKSDWWEVGDWSRLPNADYAQRYLAAHVYERYRRTGWQNPDRSERANDFLALATAPGFRTFRLDREGLGAALEDVRHALQVAFVETILPDGAQSLQALNAIERLLSAYSSDENPTIVDLERRLRLEGGGVPALREFLGLP